jgi:hypothetical protein
MLRRDFMMLIGAAAATWQAFGNRYLYARLGTSLPLGPSASAGERRARGRCSNRMT